LTVTTILWIPSEIWYFIAIILVLGYLFQLSFSVIYTFYSYVLLPVIHGCSNFLLNAWSTFRRVFKSSKKSKKHIGPASSTDNLIEVTEFSYRKKVEASISVIILLVSLVGTFLFIIFLSLQIIYETSSFVDKSFVFLNHTVIHHPTLKEFNYESHLISLAEKCSKWADDQITSVFPNSNITSKDLYSKLNDLYMSYYGPQSSRLNAEQRGGIFQNFQPRFPVVSSLYDDYKSMGLLNSLIALDYHQLYEELLSEIPIVLEETFHFDRESMNNLFSAIFSKMTFLGEKVLNSSPFLLRYISMAFFSIFNFFVYSFTILTEAILFLTILSFILEQDKSPIEYFGSLIEFVDKSHILEKSISKSLSAIFLTTGKLFAFHFLLTWLTLSLVHFPFVYIFSILSGLLAVIPIANPLIVILIPCVELYVSCAYLRLIFLAGSHGFCWWIVDSAIYADIPDSHPYISSLSIVLGLYSFGIQGIILGPLLACLPVIAYHIFANLSSSQKSES
jgi:predicted PurR-regulated permease PerM